MRFEDASEVRDQLAGKLTDRLAFYLPPEVSEESFFLRESCRFWEGVVESSTVVEVEAQRELWHHQIRDGSALQPTMKTPSLNALTSVDEGQMRLLELGRSTLAIRFHRVAGWLDSLPRRRRPKELRSGEAIVRLLSIRRSFFHGFSFHVDSELLCVVPLLLPRYFRTRRLLNSRTFYTPATLAEILSEAPDFYGVNG